MFSAIINSLHRGLEVNKILKRSRGRRRISGAKSQVRVVNASAVSVFISDFNFGMINWSKRRYDIAFRLSASGLFEYPINSPLRLLLPPHQRATTANRPRSNPRGINCRVHTIPSRKLDFGANEGTICGERSRAGPISSHYTVVMTSRQLSACPATSTRIRYTSQTRMCTTIPISEDASPNDGRILDAG